MEENSCLSMGENARIFQFQHNTDKSSFSLKVFRAEDDEKCNSYFKLDLLTIIFIAIASEITMLKILQIFYINLAAN